MTPTRILVVDDDPLVRSGLALILGGAPDLEVVGEAADGAEALVAARALRPAVVLMDLRMPRVDGLEATRALTALPEPPLVVVLTTFDVDDAVVRALEAGASGFLLKDTPPPDLVDAVRRAAAGEPMLSPTATRRLIERVTAGTDPVRRARARDRVGALTEREREVAVAVGRGLGNAEIADQLHLSVATVKAHVGRLFTKLGVENRVQVALIVNDAEGA
ncbi:response regulator transcription factor [Nocardioides sp. HDW12B]|uniref:response regulator n=1 Tax=Nocardioides sp. HDW12B TaxID=2714939 RepID=UPI001409F6E4|nr:response regulator transcription factor [Nocardioides sp. HDW12B]QIK65707.1 response regulator transcription factor [Nocardioides sp. HDW12B]